MPPDATPRPGDIAQVRHRQYLVDDVIAPSSAREEHTLVRLTCLDDDAQGRPLSVLWERELGAKVVRPAQTGLGVPPRLDEPRRFAAYLHALKWSSVTATDARLFQAPFRAGIHLLDHQLSPLKKALELPRVNLFIADDVGLGKTIEAGLVMQELMLRQRVERVLIVCPASVTLQWRDEMEKRFGLHFEIFTRDFVSRRRRERGFQVPVWGTHSRFIVSYQTLRRSEYFEPLKTLLDERGRQKSMLVLDEAHVVAPASSSRYAVDTETTRSIRSLADRFEHRLFLSATPHNGHSNSFSALLEMLDPQRFTRGTRVRESQLAPVMVRRLKSDLRELGSDQQYPERHVLGVRLKHDSGRWTAGWLRPDGTSVDRTVDLGAGSAAELDLSTKLGRYTQLMSPRAKQGQLVFINLQKRLQPLEKPGEMPEDRSQLFWARRIARPPKLPLEMESVIVARRLCEVQAQVGFTRIEPLSRDLQGRYDINVELAPLSLQRDWVPVTEVQGEGVLLRLDEARLHAWEISEPVLRRTELLFKAWERWRAHSKSTLPFPGVRLYLLHSMAHLLMTEVALECGYPASSIRERIYCEAHTAAVPMAGILLMTGTSGAEGTLGGLVEEGRRIGRHLARAWESSRLCSNDPVCAHHEPVGVDERYLEGAACHSCLFVPECSCERFNQYLDRALVVPTLGHEEVAFLKAPWT